MALVGAISGAGFEQVHFLVRKRVPRISQSYEDLLGVAFAFFFQGSGTLLSDVSWESATQASGLC